jgi:hypothetical protein
LDLVLLTSPSASLTGAAKPRVSTHPAYVDTYGPEAIELMVRAGQPLDAWQCDSLTLMLAVRGDGKWACFECAEIVARQNGKGGILEARVLAGLFLLGERLIMWSAHEYKTAMEAYLRVRFLIHNLIQAGVVDQADVKFNNTNGEEGVEILSTGQRLKFIARSKSSGRGFSGDVNIIDEAFAYTPQQQAALMPTMSARPNPQIIYTSSPPLTGDTGEVLYALRARGEAGGDDSLGWRDWGLAGDLDFLDGIDLDDLAAWAAANPALRIRITLETIGRERRSMSPVDFARERLGIWPKKVGAGAGLIDAKLWASLADTGSVASDLKTFAVDVTPARDHASIAVYSPRPDGPGHVELIDYRPGTDWVVARLAALKVTWNPVAIALDPRGPAGSLLLDLEQVGITAPTDPERPRRGDLALAGTQDVAAACGRIVDAARQQQLRHIDQPQLNLAVLGAAIRPLGDAWAWGRKVATQDISPLVAITLARWAHEVREPLVLADYDALANIW